MKKIFLVFVVLLLIPIATAFMPPPHTYYTLSQFRKIDSPITRLCKDREEQLMFGVSGADVPVIHYLENKLEGYKGTHSRAIYTKCFELAGSDIDLKCVCYGIGLHLIQDRTSHYEFVPKYIRKYFGSNVLIHPIVELDAQGQLEDRLESNPDTVVSNYEIFGKNGITPNALNLFWEDEKYKNLFEQSTGLDMTADFAAIDAALKGERWVKEVYGKEVNLPTFYWVIGFVIFIAGIVWLILTAIIARNKLGIISYVIGSLVTILGVGILISLFMGQSWIWFNYIAKVPAAVMDIEDTEKFDNKVLENTKRFFETEELLVDGKIVDDASGLDHLDREGNFVRGPLQEAEGRFRYFLYPITLVVLIGLVILLFWRMSKA